MIYLSKSILLGGLSLVLGSRVDNSKIINKNIKCFVEAIFDTTEYDLKSFFEQYSLDYESETILRKEVIYDEQNETEIEKDELFITKEN